MVSRFARATRLKRIARDTAQRPAVADQGSDKNFKITFRRSPHLQLQGLSQAHQAQLPPQGGGGAGVPMHAAFRRALLWRLPGLALPFADSSRQKAWP